MSTLPPPPSAPTTSDLSDWIAYVDADVRSDELAADPAATQARVTGSTIAANDALRVFCASAAQ